MRMENTLATINITNAKVGRILADKGFEAIETYKLKSGDTGETKFTVWTSSNNIPGEGSLVNVTGNVSVRVEEYQGRQFARFHVNQPTVMLLDTPQSASVPDMQEIWPQVKEIPESEVPF